MYRYDALDQALVDERVAQFRDQTRRFLAGELSEDDFRPLRLQNGLYVQKHAPMLRIAIPYGTLSSVQLRTLADVAERHDRGYGHFSTRQNLQLNWPALERVPDILAELATVQMHAIQTSGNCIRNTTTDHFAGVAPDELVDPRPYCELIRQWSTLHPEFAFLPRKFKIAVSASAGDRAAVQVHDIGLRVVRDPAAAPGEGAIGFEVWAGGGLGRTPVVAPRLRAFLPEPELLNYLEAILRVYNRFGRRDNKYKARIKILVRELGAAAFAEAVEAEYAHLRGGPSTLTPAEVARVADCFAPPPYRALDERPDVPDGALSDAPGFARWVERCVHPHKVPGYRAVTVSLKPHGLAPGDASSAQMRAVADAADAHGFGEIRVSHHQNLVLPDVERDALPALYARLRAAKLATPNVGLLTDIIACPGGDFCALANAVSIPVATSIQERFDDLDDLFDLGEIELNISGCINSCGHHHVGHIGILGVDKAGEEWYQVSLGGVQGPVASIGRILGPSFSRAQIPEVIERLMRTYVSLRESPDERFVDAVARVGLDPFKAAVYADADRPERAAA
ncbi:MAG TPA: nitrite/sulfite reductase [Burkholderiaceae bacterium]|nr:nitrite/sulfite reductase [Burkholderiaceae bacterium]